MVTVFTVPKPFRGRIGAIQRNAIESWLALGHGVQVVLVGDEEGVSPAARAAGVEHVGGLARNARGTPRLDSAFERAATVAKFPLWCFVNADILLLDDFLPAIERVATQFDEFLLIGECRDLDVGADVQLKDPAARADMHALAADRGRLRGYAALDYFVFPQGLFDPMPPFLIGRACFDNWLVWRARDMNRPVVDATQHVVAIHQSHDYAHVRGGLDEAYGGPEARYNENLAGGREHIYSLHDATHRLTSDGRLTRYWGSTLRARERARGARARVDHRIAARRTRKGGKRPIRLLGVYGRPGADTTPFLDALASAAGVDLAVLYATQGPGPTRAPRHPHWVPRSLRVARLDRALGREYPVHWAIWRSFRAHRPDCMVIEGWRTFASQAALAWCLARRVPFLLVVDGDDRESLRDRDTGRQHAVVGAVLRRAAAVIVQERASERSLAAYRVHHGRQRRLPDDPGAAAAELLALGQSAWMDRRAHSRIGGLRRLLTAPARRRRIRSAHAGPHG
jgi:hypothetical protein